MNVIRFPIMQCPDPLSRISGPTEIADGIRLSPNHRTQQAEDTQCARKKGFQKLGHRDDNSDDDDDEEEVDVCGKLSYLFATLCSDN